jgi:putative tricarboxylic transport membrane protein
MSLMSLLAALQAVFTFKMIALIFGGSALGIIVGALPGLSATMGMALMLPITFYMPPSEGILMLLGLYTGAVFGGAYSAILLNIPGAPPSVMTSLDGYPMAQKGEAGRAISLATVGSTLGGIAGVIALIIIAPILAKFALRFGPAEYTVLAVFGLSAIVAVSGKSLAKGFAGVTLGVLLSTVGMDNFTNVSRFTFGSIELMSGINFIPVVIGLFGLAEVISQILESTKEGIITKAINRLLLSAGDFRLILKGLIPASLIGIVIGVLPGAGGTIASIISYNHAMQSSKEPEKFGTGTPEGIIAAETANNASVGGAMVPLLTLGVPGSSPAAILLGALLIHNLRPGPMLFTTQPVLISTIFVGLLVAQFSLLLWGLGTARIAPWILAVRKEVMLPVIAVLCVIGAFALKNSFFDVGIMLVSGIAGFFLNKLGIKPGTIILGLILGPMFENNLRSTIEISGIAPVFTSPICVVLWVLTAAMILYPICRMLRLKKCESE